MFNIIILLENLIFVHKLNSQKTSLPGEVWDVFPDFVGVKKDHETARVCFPSAQWFIWILVLRISTFRIWTTNLQLKNVFVTEEESHTAEYIIMQCLSDVISCPN